MTRLFVYLMPNIFIADIGNFEAAITEFELHSIRYARCRVDSWMKHIRAMCQDNHDQKNWRRDGLQSIFNVWTKLRDLILRQIVSISDNSYHLHR